MNMDIVVVGTSNQVFKIGFYNETNFQKNKLVTDKTPFFVVCPFCASHFICLNIDF